MENLVIEIGAHTKEFLAGLTEVGEKTEGLGSKLQGVGLVAGAAFAGYTASILGTVAAYAAQEQVGLEINSMLKATGSVAGMTSEHIEELAHSLSRSTTFSELQVKSAEKMLLSFTRIGQDTFPAATKATLDLAQHMGGDAAGAAAILGRALEDPSSGLKKLIKQQVFFTEGQKAQIKAMQESGDMAGAQAIIIKQVESSYLGLSEITGGVTGSTKVLKNSMEELAEKIGAKFAPYVEMAAKGLTDLFRIASDNESIVKMVAITLTAGAAVSGLLAVLAGSVATFGLFSAAAGVATAALGAMGISVGVLAGATGIGLLLVALTAVSMHWNTVWPQMQQSFHTFVTTITGAAAGLYQYLKGVFHWDKADMEAGLAAAVAAFKTGTEAAKKQISEIFQATPSAKQKAEEGGRDLANASAKGVIEAEHAAEDFLRKEKGRATAATHQAELLTIEGHSAKLIALKKEEAAAFTKLGDATYVGQRAALQRHLKAIQDEYKRAATNEAAQQKIYDNLKIKEELKLTTTEKAALLSSIKTKADVKRDYEMQELNAQVAANNTYLAEEDRFGTAYAAINMAMHSKVIQGTNQAFGQLSQMTQSGWKELKAIGKAAALYDIAIKTVQSAEDVYAGLVGIPFIGPGLAIAGAAAATAYGIENANKVLAMSQGGLVTGGVSGVDSVPLLAQRGELVTPPQNYNEHIDAMVAKRGGKMDGQAPQTVNVVVSFKKDASRFLQVQTLQDKSLGTYRGGS